MNDLPSNCIAEVNGNLVCENDVGRFDIYARGEGWWAFNLSREEALRQAASIPEADRTHWLAPPVSK